MKNTLSKLNGLIRNTDKGQGFLKVEQSQQEPNLSEEMQLLQATARLIKGNNVCAAVCYYQGSLLVSSNVHQGDNLDELTPIKTLSNIGQYAAAVTEEGKSLAKNILYQEVAKSNNTAYARVIEMNQNVLQELINLGEVTTDNYQEYLQRLQVIHDHAAGQNLEIKSYCKELSQSLKDVDEVTRSLDKDIEHSKQLKTGLSKFYQTVEPYQIQLDQGQRDKERAASILADAKAIQDTQYTSEAQLIQDVGVVVGELAAQQIQQKTQQDGGGVAQAKQNLMGVALAWHQSTNERHWNLVAGYVGSAKNMVQNQRGYRIEFVGDESNKTIHAETKLVKEIIQKKDMGDLANRKALAALSKNQAQKSGQIYQQFLLKAQSQGLTNEFGKVQSSDDPDSFKELLQKAKNTGFDQNYLAMGEQDAGTGTQAGMTETFQNQLQASINSYQQSAELYNQHVELYNMQLKEIGDIENEKNLSLPLGISKPCCYGCTTIIKTHNELKELGQYKEEVPKLSFAASTGRMFLGWQFATEDEEAALCHDQKTLQGEIDEKFKRLAKERGRKREHNSDRSSSRSRSGSSRDDSSDDDGKGGKDYRSGRSRKEDKEKRRDDDRSKERGENKGQYHEFESRLPLDSIAQIKDIRQTLKGQMTLQNDQKIARSFPPQKKAPPQKEGWKL